MVVQGDVCNWWHNLQFLRGFGDACGFLCSCYLEDENSRRTRISVGLECLGVILNS